MQPRPDQLQMMVELCASSVSVSTLNAMLMKAQIMCKGLKVQKAKCLVEKLPVHKLQKLLAEAMNPPADPEATDTRSSTAGTSSRKEDKAAPDSAATGSATKRRKKETTAAKGDDTTPSRKRKYHVNARKDDEPTPSKERKKDANAPKRPAGGAYGCYLEENRQRFMQQCKGQSATAVSKMAANDGA